MESDWNDDGESFFSKLLKKFKKPKYKTTERKRKRLADGYTDEWSIEEDYKGVDVIRSRYGKIYPQSFMKEGMSIEEQVDDLNEDGYRAYLGNARAMFHGYLNKDKPKS